MACVSALQQPSFIVEARPLQFVTDLTTQLNVYLGSTLEQNVSGGLYFIPLYCL